MKSYKFAIFLMMTIFCCFLIDAQLYAGNVTADPKDDGSGNIIIAPDGNVTFTAKSSANDGTVTIDPSSNYGDDGTPSNYSGSGGTGTVVVTYDDDATGEEEDCTLYIDHKDPNGKTCSSTSSPPVKFKVFVPTIQTATESSSTQPDDRTTIGVGEDVDCTIEPADTPGAAGAVWEKSGSGTFATNGGQSVVYTAYCQADTDTLTVYLFPGGKTLPTVTFNVIAPSATNQPWWSTTYNGNHYIGVDMWTKIYLAPDTVSFANCSFVEGYCSARTSGYWNYTSGVEHTPAGPLSCTDNVVAGEGTEVGGSDFGDHVSLGTMGPTYSAGDFLWPIPHKYTANGTTFQYTTQNHHGVLTVVNGEASETLTKAQASITSQQYP